MSSVSQLWSNLYFSFEYRPMCCLSPATVYFLFFLFMCLNLYNTIYVSFSLLYHLFCRTPGVIKTALPNMDREVKEQYQVLIQAKDMGGQLGGLAGTTTVNITLSDVNDNPPRFSKSEQQNFQFHFNWSSKVHRGDNLNLGNGVSSCLLYGIGFHYFSSNTTACLFSRVESTATIPTNKPGVVLLGTRDILLYLDQVWADDGAAPGIDLVYLNTAFYPVFCISCWTRLIRLYRS